MFNPTHYLHEGKAEAKMALLTIDDGTCPFEMEFHWMET